MKNRALFLDRDGVVNVDTGYLYKIEEWRFMPGILEILRFFKERGFLLVLITNQSGIHRGYYGVRDFIELTHFMQGELVRLLGFGLDRVYFCPHLPSEDCACRKPRAGMILQALSELEIDPHASWLIGDKPSDITAAFRASIAHSVLLNPSEESQDKPLFRVDSLSSLHEILRHYEPLQ